jgi:hypothetical protein
MPSPFDSITLEAVRRAVEEARPAWLAANVAFYDGDHWQAAAGWAGPQPASTDPEAAAVLAEIQRAFVSKNAVREVVRRHADGVIGREPAWALTMRRPLADGDEPTPDERARIAEAEAILTAWWDARAALGLLRKTAATLLLGASAGLRLYVPPGRLIDGRVPVTSLDTALDHLFLDHPAAGQVVLLTDRATQLTAVAYVATDDRQQTTAELSYVDPDDGTTVIRVLRGDPTTDPPPARLPLHGEPWLRVLRRDALVSAQVRQLQQQLNLAKTMEGRNVVQGGFLERIVLNGQLPGSYVDDPSAPPDDQGRRKRFVPRPMRIGAGQTNWIAGAAIRNDAGDVTGYATPSVVYRDPVRPDTFQATASGAYRAILEETQQLHALLAGDASASGESRAQARADFELSLADTRAQIEAAGRWLLEAALASAALFAGQPGRFTDLRAEFTCRITTGPLTLAERQSILNEYNRGLLSAETAMSRLGTDDIAAERARIAAERAAAPPQPPIAAPAAAA